jgi:hypothetical protein
VLVCTLLIRVETPLPPIRVSLPPEPAATSVSVPVVPARRTSFRASAMSVSTPLPATSVSLLPDAVSVSAPLPAISVSLLPDAVSVLAPLVAISVSLAPVAVNVSDDEPTTVSLLPETVTTVAPMSWSFVLVPFTLAVPAMRFTVTLLTA